MPEDGDAMARKTRRHRPGSLKIVGGLIALFTLHCANLGTLAAQIPELGTAEVPTAQYSAMTRPECLSPLPIERIEPSGRVGGGAFVKKLSANDALFEVIIGQGRLLTLERDIVEPGQPDQPSPFIAVGDPSVVDFEIVGPRQIRVTGQRIGTTDLSIVPAAGEPFSLEVHVVVDLDFLRARLRQAFPDAVLQLSHLREHLIVEGQARDSRQVSQIIRTIELYLESTQVSRRVQGGTGPPMDTPSRGGPPGDVPQGDGIIPQDDLDAAIADAALEDAVPGVGNSAADPGFPGDITPDIARPNVRVQLPGPEVINLIRLPGPQQVMLKVQVAELNRTAMRQLGVNALFQDGNFTIGSDIGGGLPIVRKTRAGTCWGC